MPMPGQEHARPEFTRPDGAPGTHNPRLPAKLAAGLTIKVDNRYAEFYCVGNP